MIPLGPFTLERPIGRGGMGEVWRGHHAGQGVPVAVKVVTTQVARQADYRAWFRNEVRAVAGLDHEHVVLVLDHGEVDQEAEGASGGALQRGFPYLVMEWASRGTLARRGAIRSWPALREALAALLDALAHAHARGVIAADPTGTAARSGRASPGAAAIAARGLPARAGPASARRVDRAAHRGGPGAPLRARGGRRVGPDVRGR